MSACSRQIPAGLLPLPPPDRIPRSSPLAFYSTSPNSKPSSRRIALRTDRPWIGDPVLSGRGVLVRSEPRDSGSRRFSVRYSALEKKVGEKRGKRKKAEVVAAVVITVLLGVVNRVLYKLALVPLKQYPFFLAQLATFGYALSPTHYPLPLHLPSSRSLCGPRGKRRCSTVDFVGPIFAPRLRCPCLGACAGHDIKKMRSHEMKWVSKRTARISGICCVPTASIITCCLDALLCACIRLKPLESLGPRLSDPERLGTIWLRCPPVKVALLARGTA
ncbi:hypothetical protein ACLOJK_024664 [Asimina triloba]